MDLTLENIIKEIADSGLTAYKIAQGLDGELTEAGINKILNGTTKKPNQKTLVKIHNYLAKQKDESLLKSNVIEPDPFTDAIIDKLKTSPKFNEWIDWKINEENKKLVNAIADVEIAKVRKRLEKNPKKEQN